MKKLVVFLVIVFVNVFVNVSVCSAQGLKYSFDSKVIMADSISHPQTSSLLEVLQTLPELLHRSSSSMLDNYYMTIDCLPVGSSSDVILSTILLEDIDEISISSSSTSNYDNNGQGGSINISLKHPKKGFSGNAYGGVAYPFDFMPGASLNYQNDKWTVRSFLTGDFSKQNGIKNSFYTMKGGQRVAGCSGETNKDESGIDQLAKIYASYSDGKNNLNFTFYEKYDRSKSDQTTEKESEENTILCYNSSRNLEMMFKTSYGRQLAWKGSFSAEALYRYNPGRDKSEEYKLINESSDADINRHSISGGICYDQSIGYKDKSLYGAHFTVGVNTNYTYNYSQADMLVDIYSLMHKTTYHTFYISPYFRAQANLGKFEIQGQIEYQSYVYNLKKIVEFEGEIDEDVEYDNKAKDYVGTFASVWNISKNHILRFIASRSLKRPTESQLLPYMSFSYNDSHYEQGNSGLKPMIINSLDLGYLFSHDTEKNHWQASFDARYIHTYDNITYISRYDSYLESTVTTIENTGKDNILNLDAMVQWKHDWFSVQATGNYFYRHTIGTDSYYSYYNFALTPQIMTNNNWTIAMGVNHSTKTVYNSVTQPALTVLKLHLAKTWNHLTLFLAGNLSLNHMIEEQTTLEEGSYSAKYYVPVDNTLYAGIRYNF